MNELARELFKTCRNFLWYQILAENEPSEVGRFLIVFPENPQELQDSDRICCYNWFRVHQVFKRMKICLYYLLTNDHPLELFRWTLYCTGIFLRGFPMPKKKQIFDFVLCFFLGEFLKTTVDFSLYFSLNCSLDFSLDT